MGKAWGIEDANYARETGDAAGRLIIEVEMFDSQGKRGWAGMGVVGVGGRGLAKFCSCIDTSIFEETPGIS